MDEKQLLDYYHSGGDLSTLTPDDRATLFRLVMGGGQGRLPFGSGTNSEQNLEGITGNDVLTLLGKGAEFGAGFIPGSLPARMAVQGVIGSLTGVVSEDDTALNEGLTNAGLEVLPSVGGQLARGGLWLALKTSGAAKNTAGATREIVDSFMRERGRQWSPSEIWNSIRNFEFGGGIPVGGQTRTALAKQRVGKELAAEETSLPGSFPIDDALNAADELTTTLRSTSDLPISNVNRVNRALKQSVEEMIAARGGRQTSTVYGPPDVIEPTDLARTTPPAAPPTTGQELVPRGQTALSTHRRRRYRTNWPDQPGQVGQGDFVLDQFPQGTRTETPRLNVREAGEVARRLRHQAQRPADMRRQGAFVPESADLTAEQRLAFAQRLFELQDQAIREAGGDPTKLAAIRERFGDLATMFGANNRVRKGVSAFGIRGGTGAGTGSGIGMILSAMGIIDPQTALLMGAGGGLLGSLATPQNLSRAGFYLDDILSAAPHATRGIDIGMDLTKDDPAPTPNVRRRSPR